MSPRRGSMHPQARPRARPRIRPRTHLVHRLEEELEWRRGHGHARCAGLHALSVAVGAEQHDAPGSAALRLEPLEHRLPIVERLGRGEDGHRPIGLELAGGPLAARVARRHKHALQGQGSSACVGGGRGLAAPTTPRCSRCCCELGCLAAAYRLPAPARRLTSPTSVSPKPSVSQSTWVLLLRSAVSCAWGHNRCRAAPPCCSCCCSLRVGVGRSGWALAAAAACARPPPARPATPPRPPIPFRSPQLRAAVLLQSSVGPAARGCGRLALSPGESRCGMPPLPNPQPPRARTAAGAGAQRVAGCPALPSWP